MFDLGYNNFIDIVKCWWVAWLILSLFLLTITIATVVDNKASKHWKYVARQAISEKYLHSHTVYAPPYYPVAAAE